MSMYFARHTIHGLFIAAIFAAPLAAFAADTDPTPRAPQQVQPWNPPATTLPPAVIAAAVQLFQDGLPDPRGCEYRKVEMVMSKGWTDKFNVWVLPGNGPQRYAIGWNGIVYHVDSVGDPVNLDQEFAALNHAPGRRAFREGRYWPTGAGMNLVSAQPLQVAFLLRLGKARLAEQAWAEGCNGDNALLNSDPYPEMAVLWLDGSFHHAMDAFVRGDDSTALDICRQISPIVAQSKAIAIARAGADAWPEKKFGGHLWQLPALQADLERRAQEKPYTPVLESTTPMPEGPGRIAALIRDLELVHAEQFMNPGDANVADDPIVQALVKEGQPAVEPLLGVLASDDRLTRTHYTEGMGYDGPIVPVYECAYKALFSILNVEFPLFEQDSTDYRERKDPRAMTGDDRARLAGKLANVWAKMQGMSLADSGYLALQDDKAGPDDWFRAIDNIAQPADGTFTSYVLMPPQGGYSNHMGPPPYARKGDALRAKKNPSVSDLIIKRFEQLVQGQGTAFDSNKLSNMLLALADWDGRNHVADLKRLGAELDARVQQETGKKSGQVNVALVERRLELGDASALADYLAYMKGLSAEDLKNFYHNGQGAGEFSILWHYPDDPGAQQVAGKIFNGKDAPLVPLPNSFIATPLIGLPAVRGELLRGLVDKSPGGTYTAQDGGYNIQFTATQGNTGGGPAPPDAPKPGTTVDFRLCDIYAHELARIEGFPACELYWPEAKRDAAVSAAKSLLTQYGDALKAWPDDPYDEGMFYDPVAPVRRFRLAPLDHPATPDEVKAGRAIFSLSGPARVWKMPSYPLGPALQAEEVPGNDKSDGRWQRFFGVIRNGRPVQVPAAEMEFQNTLLGSVDVTKQIGGAFTALEMSEPFFNFGFSRNRFVDAAAPQPFHVTLINHNGEDQSVPAELVLPPHASKTLPTGLALEVSWSPKIPPALQRYDAPKFDYGPFQNLPLRANLTVTKPSTPGPILPPTGTCTILEGDLRDYFDLTRPGTYKAKVRFQVPTQLPAETYEITFSLAPKEQKL